MYTVKHNYILQRCYFATCFGQSPGFCIGIGIFTFKLYNTMTIILCALRDLVLHALYYYVNSNISLHPVYMLSCVRVVALPFGSGVVTPLFTYVLLRLCAVFRAVRGVMVSRCWVLRLECPFFGGAPCAGGRCQSPASPLY
jgi:hypothetical protein